MLVVGIRNVRVGVIIGNTLNSVVFAVCILESYFVSGGVAKFMEGNFANDFGVIKTRDSTSGII